MSAFDDNQKRQQSDEHRKRFAMGISIVATILTLVSLSASYSTYLEAFTDWGGFGKLLAAGTAIGVEIAFALLVYGVTYALIGKESAIAGIGAFGLLVMMAINFVTHAMRVRGFPLAGWQEAYVQWVGMVVPFAVILLILFVSYSLHESEERRLSRQIDILSRRRALQYKKAYINSEELVDALQGMNSQIATEVKRQMQLPAHSTAHRAPGFSSQTDGDPKS